MIFSNIKTANNLWYHVQTMKPRAGRNTVHFGQNLVVFIFSWILVARKPQISQDIVVFDWNSVGYIFS